jgi:hypothetical protein
MKTILFLFFWGLLFSHAKLFAQNVGIGTSTPAQKLDVQGNINLSGGLRANGTAGLLGQVLTADNLGNISWAYAGRFPNFVSFNYNTGWTVPANVTTVLIEAWGGGGGGSTNGGGSGGAYIVGLVNVTPGNILTVTAGSGGTGGSAATGGGNSTVVAGATTLIASGGYSGDFAGNYTSFNVNPIGANLIGYDGDVGRPGEGAATTAIGYISSGNYLYNTHFGDGGNAGNTNNTGGLAGIASGITGNFFGLGAGTTIRPACIPGGGGCQNSTNTNSTLYNEGAMGKVVIHY